MVSFSICIPVYNTYKYLSDCLDSALAQHCEKYEILVVDDGSTDNSALICDDYAKHYPQRIKVFHQDNQGLILARRKAIQNATCDFCLFLDSDDIMIQNALETLTRIIEQHNADMVLFHYSSCADNDNTPIHVDKRLPFSDIQLFTGKAKDILYDTLIADDMLNMLCMKCIRRELIQQDPLDYTRFKGFSVCEDLLQTLYPITQAKRIVYTGTPLYVYRMNPDSLTHHLKLNNLKSKTAVHVFDHFLTFLPAWNRNTQSVRSHLENRWFHSICHAQFMVYQYCRTPEDFHDFFAFDWKSMVPQQALDHLSENSEISAEDRSWWSAVECQNATILSHLLLRKRLFVYRQYFKAALRNAFSPRQLWLKIKAHLN